MRSHPYLEILWNSGSKNSYITSQRVLTVKLWRKSYPRQKIKCFWYEFWGTKMVNIDNFEVMTLKLHQKHRRRVICGCRNIARWEGLLLPRTSGLTSGESSEQSRHNYIVVEVDPPTKIQYGTSATQCKPFKRLDIGDDCCLSHAKAFQFRCTVNFKWSRKWGTSDGLLVIQLTISQARCI